MKDVVSRAVEECIAEGILAKFFTEHKTEIIEMGPDELKLRGFSNEQ